MRPMIRSVLPSAVPIPRQRFGPRTFPQVLSLNARRPQWETTRSPAPSSQTTTAIRWKTCNLHRLTPTLGSATNSCFRTLLTPIKFVNSPTSKNTTTRKFLTNNSFSHSTLIGQSSLSISSMAPVRSFLPPIYPQLTVRQLQFQASSQQIQLRPLTRQRRLQQQQQHLATRQQQKQQLIQQHRYYFDSRKARKKRPKTPNPFKVLAVPEGSLYKDVKKKFLQIAMKNHPDTYTSKGDITDEERDKMRDAFIAARVAYESLTEDPTDGTAIRIKDLVDDPRTREQNFDSWFQSETGWKTPFHFDMEPETMKEVAKMTETIGSGDAGGLDRDGGMWALARMVASAVKAGSDAATLLRLEGGDVKDGGRNKSVNGELRRRRKR